MKKEWIHGLDAAITICDKNGIIRYMNRKSVETFSKEGGKKLIGSKLMDCHSRDSRKIIEEMFKNQKENIYSIEKAGQKKLIIQKPVYDHRNFDGIIEISILLPEVMPHHKRD